jgi:lipoprotein-anchoring transpeptidase ErfK/SrfK
VKIPLCLALVAAMLATNTLQAAHKKSGTHAKPPREQKRDPAQIEAATRLQVFLDRANFSPGALNGHYGEFTIKALALYRQSRGEQPPAPPARPDTAPDISGLDLASFGPAFILYTVTDADLQNIGPAPSAIAAQAKLKFLPYRNAAEAVAEKFRCGVHFLEQLNPGKTKTIKAGDQLKVPNVEPFELTAVKDLKPGSEIASLTANDLPDESDARNEESVPATKERSAELGRPAISVKIDTKTNMLGVFEADKLVAAYPVTIGSAQTASPIGEWKVRQIVKLPRFRYDEEMLKHGRRSGNFHILPPGPNSPVGVIWIALNKKGIGLHGTNEPETIGRSVSHGCVRLANWDVVRLAQKVKAGVPVSIQ